MPLDGPFLKFSAEKLEQLCSRIQDCLGKLSEEQIWARGTENENAIGNLVLHLAGNVRQWIGAGVAGKPDIRERDAEFAARGDASAAELGDRLNTNVREAVEVIRGLTPERLAEMTTVQKYHTTVLEAVYHVVEHFAQHTGQIMFATKLFTGQDLGYYRHLSKAAHSEKTP